MRKLLLPLAAGLLAGCAAAPPSPIRPATVPASTSPSPTATAAVLLQVHDPGQVTGTLTGPCRTSDGGQLPDPACTPGAYDPQVTAAVLCAPGYSTRTYRPPESQTEAFKFHSAFPAYGIPASAGPAELDHLVSLELGGSNDAANLWPEMGPVPNAKDGVENALHAWVCAATGQDAQTRLREAQQAIATDWLTAEQVLGIK